MTVNRGRVNSFTVATYNILATSYIRHEWYPGTDRNLLLDRVRLPAVARRVADLAADICCLQEVERDASDLIESRLATRGYVGEFAMKGGHRPDGCATFFRAERLTLLECTRLEYRERLEARPSGHIAQVLRFGIGDRVLTIVNTHLRWDPPNTPIERQYGCCQVSELLALLDEHPPSLPCVVCGDFNAQPDSDVVRSMQVAGLTFSHAGQPTAATCNANRQAKLIDYIFYRGPLRPEPLPLVPVADDTPLPGPDQPSDHVPVVARFVLD